MFLSYTRDSDISETDPISLEDVKDIDPLNRFFLRNKTELLEDGSWKSTGEIYDIDSLKELQSNPMTRLNIPEDAKKMLAWRIENGQNVKQIMEERKTKNFYEGLVYALGKIPKKYPKDYLELLLYEEKKDVKDKYFSYVVNNLRMEDLPCYHDITRQQAELYVKDAKYASWLFRPSSQTVEVFHFEKMKDGKKITELVPMGKSYAVTQVGGDKIVNYLICYVRSLGYVVGSDITKRFEGPFFPSLKELFKVLNLDPARYL